MCSNKANFNLSSYSPFLKNWKMNEQFVNQKKKKTADNINI